jgi:hypothetical protein
MIQTTLPIQIKYKDDEGDFITISSLVELQNAFVISPKDSPLKLFISLYDSKIAPNENISFNLPNSPFTDPVVQPSPYPYPTKTFQPDFGIPNPNEWRSSKKQFHQLQREYIRLKYEGSKEQRKQFKQTYLKPIRQQWHSNKHNRRCNKEKQKICSPYSVNYCFKPKHFLSQNNSVDIPVKISNTGSVVIPASTLQNIKKCKFLNALTEITVPSLSPGTSIDIIIRCQTSANFGLHKLKFVFKLPDNTIIGKKLIIRIKVCDWAIHNQRWNRCNQTLNQKWRIQANQLIEMGYPKNPTMFFLLEKYNGDISSVVAEMSRR